MKNRKNNRISKSICALIAVLYFTPLVWAQRDVELSTEPQLGQAVVVPRRAEVGRCMSSPGQLDRCFRAVANGVKYTVAYRRRGIHGNIVTYLHTDDPNFRSPEGLRVGDVVVIDNITKIIAAPGFEIYASNANGWVPVLGFSGEVDVVGQSGADEKKQVGSLDPTAHDPVRLRIKSFSMRRNFTGADGNRRSEATTH
jgi:hypothetical protein